MHTNKTFKEKTFLEMERKANAIVDGQAPCNGKAMRAIVENYNLGHYMRGETYNQVLDILIELTPEDAEDHITTKNYIRTR